MYSFVTCQDNRGVQTGLDPFFLLTQLQREKKSGLAMRDYFCMGLAIPNQCCQTVINLI